MLGILPSLAVASTVQPIDVRSGNYPNNYVDGQSYGIYQSQIKLTSGITKYRLHFSKIGISTGDAVYISSGPFHNTSTIYYTQSTGGFTTNVWSPWITGNTGYVTLVTNNDGNTGIGYSIDQIEFEGVAGQSSAPFTNGIFASAAALKVWQDTSMNTYGYSNFVTSALPEWDNITNADVSLTTTTIQSNADIRLYAGDYSYMGYFAITKAFNTSGTDITGNGSTWYKSSSFFNYPVMNAWAFTSTNKQKTVTHEIGHNIGLNDQDTWDTNSIMRQGRLDIIHPSSIDILNIQNKW